MWCTRDYNSSFIISLFFLFETRVVHAASPIKNSCSALTENYLMTENLEPKLVCEIFVHEALSGGVILLV